MEKQELIDILNQLTDAQIVCLLYKTLDCSAKEVAGFRKMSIRMVYHNNNKVNNAKRHDDVVAAFQELFCFKR